jgi:hypothetical protein
LTRTFPMSLFRLLRACGNELSGLVCSWTYSARAASKLSRPARRPRFSRPLLEEALPETGLASSIVGMMDGLCVPGLREVNGSWEIKISSWTLLFLEVVRYT